MNNLDSITKISQSMVNKIQRFLAVALANTFTLVSMTVLYEMPIFLTIILVGLSLFPVIVFYLLYITASDLSDLPETMKTLKIDASKIPEYKADGSFSSFFYLLRALWGIAEIKGVIGGISLFVNPIFYLALILSTLANAFLAFANILMLASAVF